MIEIDTRSVVRTGYSSDSPPVIQRQWEEARECHTLGPWFPSVPRLGGFEFVAVRRLARDRGQGQPWIVWLTTTSTTNLVVCAHMPIARNQSLDSW